MLSANLRIVTELPMMGTAQVTLKAQVDGAIAQVAPVTLDFGDLKVKSSAMKTVQIKNLGNREAPDADRGGDGHVAWCRCDVGGPLDHPVERR